MFSGATMEGVLKVFQIEGFCGRGIQPLAALAAVRRMLQRCWCFPFHWGQHATSALFWFKVSAGFSPPPTPGAVFQHQISTEVSELLCSAFPLVCSCPSQLQVRFCFPGWNSKYSHLYMVLETKDGIKMRKSLENVIAPSSELLKAARYYVSWGFNYRSEKVLLVIFQMIEGIQSFWLLCHFSALLPPLVVHSPLVASVCESGRDEKK